MNNSDDKFPLPEPRKPSRFLGCFGFSSRRKPPVVLEKSRSIKKQKKRFISWPSKKSATKTVPLDGAVSDQKVESDDAKSTLKKKRRCKSVDQKKSSKSKVTRQIPVDEKVVSGEREPKHGPQEITGELEEKIITENRDSTNDQTKSPKGTNNTLHKQFCRKIDAIRGGQSQPGSPDIKPKSNRPSSVSRSTSMPIPNNLKPVGINKTSSKLKKTQNVKKEANGNKFDPVVGLSIIMVTLVIMIFWGRLCAILCTSAWFYFIPRFRTGSNQNVNSMQGSIWGEPDFDSEEYKKRVVLEGFLERNKHRSAM